MQTTEEQRNVMVSLFLLVSTCVSCVRRLKESEWKQSPMTSWVLLPQTLGC